MGIEIDDGMMPHGTFRVSGRRVTRGWNGDSVGEESSWDGEWHAITSGREPASEGLVTVCVEISGLGVMQMLKMGRGRVEDLHRGDPEKARVLVKEALDSMGEWGPQIRGMEVAKVSMNGNRVP